MFISAVELLASNRSIICTLVPALRAYLLDQFSFHAKTNGNLQNFSTIHAFVNQQGN
jgi:hypothetical protein